MGYTKDGQFYGLLDPRVVYRRALDTIAVESGYCSYEELLFLANDDQDTEAILLSVKELAENEVARYSKEQLIRTEVKHD